VRYRRRRLTDAEELAAGVVAGGVAVAVGLVSYYCTRLLLAREELSATRRPESKEVARSEE